MDPLNRSCHFDSPPKAEIFINNKLVVVAGEEDLMVIHLAYFCYIDVGDEVQETSFQSFEVVNMEMVSLVKEVKKGEFPIISLKDVRTVIKDGHPEGWGKSIGDSRQQRSL